MHMVSAIAIAIAKAFTAIQEPSRRVSGWIISMAPTAGMSSDTYESSLQWVAPINVLQETNSLFIVI